MLIVDDEDVIRHLLYEELSGAGYKVVAAHDGEEAISNLRGAPFDLALLDIKMPNIDGIEVLKFINMNYPKTKVIMLTGYSNLKYAMESKEYGAADFIAKPFTISDVLSTVERVLGQ